MNELDQNINPLSKLVVIDELKIGPVTIDKKRLSAPYQVKTKDQIDQIELIYSYHEDVFEPDDPGSQNIAAMIAAQVAVNYGLFCKKIVFSGVYDDLDQKMIKEAVENTAREIYVKKILQPNSFLIKDFVVEYHKPLDFNQAVIEFEETEGRKSTKWNLWETDKNKHAVLSSGGKESLFSYGLLDEIGKQVFPIFINESGRHWFTALNAFRHFSEKIENTKRVWTNSDRVFNWMLRHLPFIRQDFTAVRSDDYPIRLWTVAVFLFGAVPLLRKYQIGRLVIGDEFDTSVKAKYKQIAHYDGLYDQSRYFDSYLSRYYLKKGWSFNQFSILRPLSELLVEKILTARYPNLQKMQMSCHAAHQKDDRFYPCGKCEKCRRIVAMLTAIGADPKQSGYTQEQIDRCLEEIQTKDLHQEDEGKNHLLFMLQQQNFVEAVNKTKPCYEILKLRFDNEKSPFDTIPNDLRNPLFNIFLEYVEGTVKRANRKWIDIDLENDPDLHKLYPFELSTNRRKSINEMEIDDSDLSFLWGELSWPEAKKRLERVDIALLPVGAVEQHGPHLPLDTDAFDAEYLAKRVAEACSHPKPFVLPVISFGVSYHHNEFPGTIAISNDTLSRLVYEIGMSVAKDGIKKLVIINGHGGNDPALNYAAQMINKDARIFIAVDSGETSDVDIEKITETPNDVHAGEIETSTSLAIRPDLVKMERAVKLVPEFSSRYLNFSSQRGISWHAYTNKISESGVMGDPTIASPEKGEKIWKVMIAHLVTLIEDLKSISLDQLYQRRY